MGRQRFFSYGAFGRLLAQTDEGGASRRSRYDRFGNPIGGDATNARAAQEHRAHIR